jgi:hypothetical protein
VSIAHFLLKLFAIGRWYDRIIGAMERIFADTLKVKSLSVQR